MPRMLHPRKTASKCLSAGEHGTISRWASLEETRRAENLRQSIDSNADGQQQMWRAGLTREEIFGGRVRTVAHVLFRNVEPADFKYRQANQLVA